MSAKYSYMKPSFLPILPLVFTSQIKAMGIFWSHYKEQNYRFLQFRKDLVKPSNPSPTLSRTELKTQKSLLY